MKDTENEEKITIKELLTYVFIIIAIILFKNYVATPVLVSGDSMKQTLLNRDILILNKISYKLSDIKRFDIVVVEKDDEYIIKRVVGLPGEEIEYKNNKLYVNGRKIKENYYHEPTDDFTATVASNEYFVLGDNRSVSVDSRLLGAFTKRKILGKASFVIFPFNRFGFKK